MSAIVFDGGTDSNDIEAKGVFVPESRAFRFEPDFVASAPFDGPPYRMPALSATYPDHRSGGAGDRQRCHPRTA